MELIYTGPFDAVELLDVQDASGYSATVKRGERIAVPDDVGARLLEQADNWRKAPAAPKPKTEPEKPQPPAGEE